MNLVFLAHPSFLGHQSMPRFAKMLMDGMSRRGHHIELWSPRAKFYTFSTNPSLKKWLGYLDQYVIFYNEIGRKKKLCPKDALFIFTDQALGPWVPQLADRPHVIHCHDFLAQQSAQGKFPENPTRWTGTQYQKFIYRGYSKGKNFISVSYKTQQDLHQFLGVLPSVSEVVYNGMNQQFFPQERNTARDQLGKRIAVDLMNGYLLHIGGNPWYKNRAGVIEVYNAWRAANAERIPLLLIGDAPSDDLLRVHSISPFKSDIYWLSGIEDEFVRKAYAGASVFLFPSLAEGFGWPIAEAMATGCPVITTNEAPMTEVAGDAGFLIPRRPFDNNQAGGWATEAAKVVSKILAQTPAEYHESISAGIMNAKRFETENALDKIERIYERILRAGNVPTIQ